MAIDPNMNSSDYEKLLEGVTDDQIQENSPLAPSAEEPAPAVAPEKKETVEEEEEGEKDQAGESEDDPANPATEQPKKSSSVARILAEKNSYKKKYEELLAKQKTIEGDEEMDPLDRDKQIIDTTSRMAYHSEKMDDLDKQVESEFYAETPKAEKYKSDIEALKVEYPQLPIDKLRYLFASQNDPMLLLDQQQINKAKGGDLSMLGDKGTAPRATEKKPSEMGSKELEDKLLEFEAKGEVV